jgi:hypothetical protein
MRALKALVIVMGVLILAGMGLVSYGIVKRTAMPERPAQPAAAARPYGPVELALPSGARIARTRTSGERLIVELELASGGERLLVLDLATGGLVGTIDLKPQP